MLWGETKSSIIRVVFIQKKLLTTTHFKFDQTSSLFSESNIIKLPDTTSIENYVFVSNSLKIQLPGIFNIWFDFSSGTRKDQTSCSEKGMLKVKFFKMEKKQLYKVQQTHGIAFKNS